MVRKLFKETNNNIKIFGAKAKNSTHWAPDMTECPACGDTSFDTKKGRCTKCSYRESLNDSENYKVKFFQVFEAPKSPKENGEIIGQRGTLDDANAFGKEKVGEGNYIIKAVCDDGKTRYIDNDTKASDYRMVESIKVDTIADYIVDHYDFDNIDDKYSCINSIRNSFKGQETISEEELEQFIGAHNGYDKQVESITESNQNKYELYNNFVIIPSFSGDGYNIYSYDSYNQQLHLEDEGFGTLKDAKSAIDTWTKSKKENLAKESRTPQKGDRVQMDYYAKTNNGAKGTVRDKIGELYFIDWDDGTNSTEIKGFLKLLSEAITETVAEDKPVYNKEPLEKDLLALDGVDKLDWDLDNYFEIPQVIVLVHREIENNIDLSDYYAKRSQLLKNVLSVFKKHNLELEDPIEDQGEWWYFVLEEIEA